MRHDVTLADGDVLATLEVPADGGVPAGDPLLGHDRWVVHLFHGLTGCANSGYVRRAAEHFSRHGRTVVAVNHRGAGVGAGRACGLYHSGVSADIAAALAAGRARHPAAKHLAIGYSLSGNALLLLLGRDRSSPAAGSSPGQPDAAIAVNPPVDLAACVERLGRGVNRLYERQFVRGCLQAVAERVAAGLLAPQASVGRGDSIRLFDERVTAPRAGFTGADDYYRRCSAGPWLAQIDCPTRIITARDDPLIDWRSLTSAPRSGAVTLHVEDTGGHLGYVERRGVFGYRRWLEGALEDAFAILRERTQ